MPRLLRLFWMAGSDDDVTSLRRELAARDFEVEMLSAASADDGRRALAGGAWDAAICSVRGKEVPATVEALAAATSDLRPALIFLADRFEDVAEAACQLGVRVCLRGYMSQLVAAIERAAAEAEQKREALRERRFELGQREVLERIAAGARLNEVLESIVRLIAQQADEMACSILLVDEQQSVRHAAASGLPAEFMAAIDGGAIGPAAGSCGTAAYRRERVIVEDIETHDLWRGYRRHALAYGLRACWANPIFSPQRDVLGTFAMYYRTARGPTEREIAWVDRATHLASIALVRDRDEQVLRSSEARYRQLIDTAYEGVWLTDARGRTVFVNGRSCELLGYRADELVGREVTEFVDPASHGCMRELQERTQHASQQVELAFRRKDGARLWAIVAASAMRTEQGELVGMLGMLTDITERKQAERALRQSQRIESLSTLAGGIAHDFNNILMAIAGNVSLASGDLAPDHPVQESLREIEAAGVRAADLVRQVMTFSRKQAFQPQPLRVNTVVAAALMPLTASLPDSIRIHSQYAPDLPEVMGDPSQLQELVTNLARNAAQAMRDTGGMLNVRVDPIEARGSFRAGGTELAAGSYVKIEIDDTGTGIDAATLERIFDPFFTTKVPGEGAGLGLSVVHGIVKTHNGAIEVRSTPTHGSSFAVYLPAHVAKGPRPRATPVRGEGERVLCLDDEEAVVRVTAQMLRRLGYRATGHIDPLVALREFEAQPEAVDIVLTDFAMPQLTCIELVRAIRAVRPALPIVVTSGRLDADDILALQKLGVREVVWKPSTTAELSAALRRALRAPLS